MNKSLLKLAGVLLLALSVSSLAKADPINGVITFTGSVTLDNPIVHVFPGPPVSSTPWATTAVFVNPEVQGASGNFTSFVTTNEPVSFAPSWNFSTGGAVSNFWSVGGFTFNLSSSTIVVQALIGGTQFLNVTGTGIVSGNGFDATVGSWSFTTQDPASAGSFSFSASTGVPDGGTTALLVGLGLVGMSFIARRRK